jgi:hypothetical protein
LQIARPKIKLARPVFSSAIPSPEFHSAALCPRDLSEKPDVARGQPTGLQRAQARSATAQGISAIWGLVLDHLVDKHAQAAAEAASAGLELFRKRRFDESRRDSRHRFQATDTR